MINLVKLNDDCIYNMLTYLEAFEVVKCSLINKQFCEVHKNEILWKKLFENTFCHINCNNNFYTNYIKQIKLDILIFKNIIHRGNNYNPGFIDIGNKKISYISRQVEKLVHLKSLQLCSNKLQTIPIYLCKLSNLQALDLTNNKLKYIPPEIGGLSQLQNLFLSKNELVSLPTEICDLTYLEWLAIHDNKIQKLPEKISNLKKLRHLTINYELKKDIPHEILNSVNIKITYLRS